MSHKIEEAYIHILQYIKSNVIDMNPKNVISDFECGIRNAFKYVYPEVKMIGCWFHYTNALRRKASKITGFISHLNRNKQAKSLYSKFVYLPLLKPSHITEAYHLLRKEAMDEKFISGQSRESFFIPFIKYFEHQWMKKVSEYLYVFIEIYKINLYILPFNNF